MLEPAVVAPRVSRHGPAAWRQIFGEFEALVAESNRHDPCTGAGDPLQALEALAGQLDVRHLLEEEHPGIEVDRAVHVADGDADSGDPTGQRAVGRLLGPGRTMVEAEDRPCQEDERDRGEPADRIERHAAYPQRKMQRRLPP